MSVKKAAISVIVAASLLAANLSPLATAANAKDWHRHGDRAYSRMDHGPRKHFRGHRHDHHAHHRHHRDRSGKNFAKGLAIGLGILAVGSILASEAHR